MGVVEVGPAEGEGRSLPNLIALTTEMDEPLVASVRAVTEALP
ncbi:conserved hypothetical protein [Methylorubrum extorquens AM1]|uniref:Uncharacterized protein n=1 Tax=Methylorubrum extorquens (strain ATCC 14718 / DSM 1338 / JCM 2805 / NCIMB 9133 / AM1) TaxID=272630 RepID=C5B369_METEA|nr:conserved hypothetical protein [Methylorubrum extorquens AM1]